MGKDQVRFRRIGSRGKVWLWHGFRFCKWCVGILLVFCFWLSVSPVLAQQFVVELAWVDNSSNEDGFRVERKLGQTGAYASLVTVGPNVQAYADTAVNPGVTYCYRVKAFNSAGESGYTNEACGMPQPPTSSAAATSGSTSTSAPPAAAGGGGGGGSGGGGCFIATAAFGSALAPEVQLLREVRDRYLLPHSLGRRAVETYYVLSPPLADIIGRSEVLRGIVRFTLVPLVGWAALALWSPVAGLSIPVLSCIAGLWIIAHGFWSR